MKLNIQNMTTKEVDQQICCFWKYKKLRIGKQFDAWKVDNILDLWKMKHSLTYDTFVDRGQLFIPKGKKPFYSRDVTQAR